MDVQFQLERRLPELNDLIKRGAMTKDEVKAVVRERSKYEQRLQRRCSLLEDFERAILYEESLLSQVREKLKAKPNCVAMRSMIGGLTGLYRRALKKFNGNLDLWARFLAFLETNCGRKLVAETHAQCISLHQDKPLVWERAATWEWKRGNIEGARNLFQRAIRIIPADPQLWEAFLRMELELVKLGHDPLVAKVIIQHAEKIFDATNLVKQVILDDKQVENVIKSHFS